MIDRVRAEKAFQAYASQYDMDNTMIRHKVEHTYRVARNCELIAKSLGMSEEEETFAWFMGLLHDIGRFEQVRRYGTFIDSVSVDHAEFGADLLFSEGVIDRFPVEGLSEASLTLLETAIRQHNKLSLPEGLDERSTRFCDLLRDADKIDIFRVVAELPFEQRIGSSKDLIQEGDEANDEVMTCVREHRCVPRKIRKTRFEGRISHCCMAFEVMYPESRRLIREQGFLNSLLDEADAEGRPRWSARQCEQLRFLRGEIEAAWGERTEERPGSESGFEGD